MKSDELELDKIIDDIKVYIPTDWATNIHEKSLKILYIEEEQTTQWPNKKVKKDKQRSTKHTHKANDRVTETSLKTGGELRCSEG